MGYDDRIIEAYELLNSKEYSYSEDVFELIYKNTIDFLNEKFDNFSQTFPHALKHEQEKNYHKEFFGVESVTNPISILHKGGLTSIMNFLLHKHDGYPLEGDRRLGVQVHHSIHSNYAFYKDRSYSYYPYQACKSSLDTPAVLEAEIDRNWVLHANNSYEAAILP